MSYPATSAVPEVGGNSVVSIRIVVVFPAPFDPSSPKISRGAMARSSASTATSEPKRRVNSVVRSTGGSVRVSMRTVMLGRLLVAQRLDGIELRRFACGEETEDHAHGAREPKGQRNDRRIEDEWDLEQRHREV